MRVAFVVLDTLRTDHVEPYGGPTGATPTLSRLADRGVVFEDCIAGAPWTPASHATMFTGQYPSDHGVRADSLEFPTDGPFLPELFSDADITTQGIGAEPWTSRRQGFDRGFDRFHDTGGHPWTHYLPLLPAGAAYAIERLRSRLGTDYGADRFDLHLFRQWARWSDSFTFLNISVAHGPYDPPAVFRDERDAHLRTDHPFVEEQSFYRYIGGETDPPDEAWDDVRRLYAAGVTHADYLLGRALDRLPDDTWVVVTADHGEHLGEGTNAVHQFSVRDELVHVPLIVAHPSLEPRRVSRTVSHVDLLPTVCRIAHDAGFDVRTPDNLPGRDLFGDDVADHRVVFTEYGPPVVATNALLNECSRIDESSLESLFVSRQAVVSGPWKLVRTPDGDRLYRRDDETVGVGDDNPRVRDRLAAAMDETLRSPPTVDRTDLDAYVDESVEDRLETLGYL